MPYNGISTREAELERQLTAVIENHCANAALFCGTCTEARKVLHAVCGIHVHPELETLRRGGVQQGQTYPCAMPAGHSGVCSPGTG